MASSTATAGIAALKGNKTGDDLLTADLGKNDYDWLLTPPGTPLMNPPDHATQTYGEDFLNHAVLPNLVRSLAAIKTSRMPASKSELITKREPPNGSMLSMRPDSSLTMRNGRNSMVRSNFGAAAGMPNNLMNMTGRRTTAGPSSRPNSRPTTPTKRSTASSAPASRPTTPTSRSKSNASAAFSRPETPTGRSRPGSASLSRPLTPSGRPTNTPFSRNGESNAVSSSSTSRNGAPLRPSTPLRRPVTSQSQPQSVSTATRSSSISKQRPGPSRSTPSSRGSSPTIKPNTWQQLSDIPGFSLEPPPNLRTSLPARPLSNSRGASVSTSRTAAPSMNTNAPTSIRLHSDMHVEKAHDVTTRRPSSPMVTRGRSNALPSLTGDRQSSISASMVRPGNKLERSPSEGAFKGNKIMEKMTPRKPFPSSLSPEMGLSSPQTKQLTRPGTPSAIKDAASVYSRSTIRKSTDVSSLRHMELRQSTSNGLRSLMRNTPTSSIYSVRPAGMRGLTTNSPMATSSNASSDYSMGMIRDPEGSEMGEELTSEGGSKTSPASQSDSLSSVLKNARLTTWLGSPEFKDETPESTTHSMPEGNKAVQQSTENSLSVESPAVCRHGCVPANCDLCNMKIRLQKLNEKCRASLRASLQVSDESHLDSLGNGNC
ncbi:hypothetical protein KP509_11G051000 [Ceratopteris richardii]|nr:hypothetical protein KP509_11G051000 [Ceratopteris richardii]KAH7425369.1 hypothetical protein KP509_11G051000 [Ceratopteris richardii]KAH7425371.1 hypothetical protein KP509_11G051000 [Ceratopteris richardii]KAH7425372.1 hypothetical protein KP509_11G051000 [Ceratopteris richardii]KAH7425373.1 hypothetical protein KP509_11G051000 [Ceratopteris richardii]